jgi:hypothetical protein
MHKISAFLLATGFAFIGTHFPGTMVGPLAFAQAQVDVEPPSAVWAAERQEVEYSVWSAVLSPFVTRLKCEPIVVKSPSVELETGTRIPGETMLERILYYHPIPGLEPETQESYLSGLHTRIDFERKFNLPVEYKVDELTLPQNYSKAKVPCGYVRLSRPGLNRSGTQALVYVEYHCGNACGWGSFFLLQKEQRCWSVKEERVALIG